MPTQQQIQLRCPRDFTPLRAHQHDGLSVLQCPECAGLWFSAAAVSACVRRFGPHLPSRASASPKDKEQQTKLPCPQCHDKLLTAHVHEGIEVDSCTTCHALWLDKGELDTFLELAESEDSFGAARKRRARERESAMDSALEASDVVLGAGRMVAQFVKWF